jgi:diacylglycerol kinase
VGLAWAEGSSYVVHAVSAALAVGLAAYLQLGPIQWALVVIAITLVLVAELLNSALERVSRAVTSEWHPVIRDALDVSSGAVLVAATGAAVLAALIFLPPLLAAL